MFHSIKLKTAAVVLGALGSISASAGTSGTLSMRPDLKKHCQTRSANVGALGLSVTESCQLLISDYSKKSIESTSYPITKNENGDYVVKRNPNGGIDTDAWGETVVRHPNTRLYSLSSDGSFGVMTDELHMSRFRNEAPNGGTTQSSLGRRIIDREYIFYPNQNREDATYELDETSGVTTVIGPNGQSLKFNADAELVEISGATIINRPALWTADDQPILDTHGGFDVVAPLKGILVKLGWKSGGSPDENPAGVSTIVSADGSQCRVKNRELFTYPHDSLWSGGAANYYSSPSNSDPQPKFRSDREIATFLKGRKGCAPVARVLDL